MPDLADIIEAVVTKVSTGAGPELAALCGGGPFHNSAPANQKPPFIVYSLVGNAPDYNTGSDYPLDVEIQFNAFTVDDTQAFRAARLLRQTLHNKTLSVEGVEYVEMTTRHIEQDDEDLSWQAIVAFTVHATEGD